MAGRICLPTFTEPNIHRHPNNHHHSVDGYTQQPQINGKHCCRAERTENNMINVYIKQRTWYQHHRKKQYDCVSESVKSAGTSSNRATRIEIFCFILVYYFISSEIGERRLWIKRKYRSSNPETRICVCVVFVFAVDCSIEKRVAQAVPSKTNLCRDFNTKE